MPMSIGQLSRLGHRLMAGWRSLRADDGGNAAIITAMATLPLMGFAALATDTAMWEISKHNMQGAADQAALAAVVAYQAGAGSDPASTGKGVASQFGFTDGVNGATVAVTKVSPSPSGYDAAYTVAISQPQAQYFSAPFLSAPTASATATAGSTSNGPCVLALSPSAASSFDASGGSGISLTDCDLDVNSSSDTGTVVSGSTSKVTAQNINLAGGYSASGGATLSANLKLNANTRQTYPDPYQNRTPPTIGSCATYRTGYNYNFNGENGQATTLNPGTYCGGLSVGGRPIDAQPRRLRFHRFERLRQRQCATHHSQ